MADSVNASLVEPLQTLEDPRIERAKQHRLLDILVMALCPLWTGGEGLQEMEFFGKSKVRWLQTFLALPYGMPSHDTFGRGFARLHPQRLQECCLSWTQAGAQLTHGALVSLDGQTVQASFARATASSPLPMGSAWCADNGGLVMGQSKTESQANESTAMPALLPLLAITGCMVTIDAMGGQTAIATQSRAQGGDDLFAWQGHHQQAYPAVTPPWQQPIAPKVPWRDAQHFSEAFDAAHGRLVRRSIWALTDLAPLPALAKWPGLPTVIAVETMRTAHHQAPVTRDYRVSLSSLGRSADTLATMMRQPWHSENTVHGSLDVTFNEDRSRMRQDHAAANMASLRRVALHLLRQAPSRQVSLRQKRLLWSLDESSLLTVLSRAT